MKSEHDVQVFRANVSNSSLKSPYPISGSVFSVFAGLLHETSAPSPPLAAVYVRLCTGPASEVYNYAIHSHVLH